EMKQLFRITTADGVIRITPARGKGSVKVTARRDGKWSYVPMPAETVGIRYRRVQDESTGEMVMTPIQSTVKNGGNK
ncbi:MAG TPA: hypothetical protein O0X38_06700, partial [Methanocorpusculum sp.]|nr:hypothetical protein [Methanocorpusculum sp.]